VDHFGFIVQNHIGTARFVGEQLVHEHLLEVFVHFAYFLSLLHIKSGSGSAGKGGNVWREEAGRVRPSIGTW
jgi:hypothetical protein